jgi:type VI secretion system protein ImpB
MAMQPTKPSAPPVRSGPRVQITRELWDGSAWVEKELPFVLGVVGDFSGRSDDRRASLRDRAFLEIDATSFDRILAEMAPRLAFEVRNRLAAGEDSPIRVELAFQALDDFSPAKVARQVAPLAKLIQTRERLVEVLVRMDGNDRLEDFLDSVLRDPERRDRLRQALRAETAQVSDDTPADATAQRAPSAETPAGSSLLDSLLDSMQIRAPQFRDRAKQILAALLADVIEHALVFEKSAEKTIQ